MDSVRRNDYIDWLINAKDLDLIKVVTGIRRSGKSTLLRQYFQYLSDSGVNEDNIIFINFEDFANSDLLDPRELHAHILKNTQGKDKSYVFLDEVQNVPEFQRVVDSLYLRKNLDIYVTGSNASLLSGELATLLTGRYIELQILPLSFKEFHDFFKDKECSDKDLYTKYISTTSFPYITSIYGNDDVVDGYLEGIVDSVLFRDVITRLNGCNEAILMSIIRFVASAIGCRLSPRKIANTLCSMGRRVDTRTVEKYLSVLVDSHIFYEATRFDIKGKTYLSRNEKYYIADIGLRNTLLGKKGDDLGSTLESVVYLELLRRYKKVYVGKYDDLEVDFVCEGTSETSYFQVSLSVRDEETLKRELKPLKKVEDNYPKFLITLDDDPTASLDGIVRINALEWLLN